MRSILPLLALAFLLAGCVVDREPEAGSTDQAMIESAVADYRISVLAAAKKYAATNETAADVTEAAFGAAAPIEARYRAALSNFLGGHQNFSSGVVRDTVEDKVLRLKEELRPLAKKAVLDARLAAPKP